VSLASAAILLPSGWHSFSAPGTANGTLDNAANCSAGMDGSVGGAGRYGADSGPGIVWMSLTQGACNVPRHLLCVCY
jgi:hypothetical protein